VRRQLSLLVAATTSVVVVAFLLPLALLVRTFAADRAQRAATLEAQLLTPTVATVDARTLASRVGQLNAAGQRRTTVFLADGSVVGAPAERDSAVRLAARGRSFSVDVPTGRVVLVPVEGTPGGTAIIRTFVPTALLRRGVMQAWLILGGLGVTLLGAAIAVADRVARALVRPLTETAGVATRLAEGDLSARVAPDGPPEVRSVGVTLNRLADRIADLLTAEREAVADLSHRLRTPVTALRLDSEGLSDPEEAARLGSDVDVLERMVDQIIREARRPVREGVRAACDATAVVAERVGFWRVLAEDQGRPVSLTLPPTPCPVRLPPEDLAAALDALLGNVFAHTPEGSGFVVRLTPGNGVSRLLVRDSGPGFPVAARSARRGESGTGSTGLGLDIARRAAQAAGGSLRMGSAPRGGAEVELILPPPD
jgi:signal transduction histidine kinase